MPHKRKKKGERRAKEAGRRESIKDERAAKLEILLSAHAQTLKAVIWAAKGQRNFLKKKTISKFCFLRMPEL